MYGIIALQLWGGRGSTYSPPSGSGNGGFEPNAVAPKVADTLKEALGDKGRPYGMIAAYKDANPLYDKTMTYKAYTANCQRCVVAYELRRRGYDVTALPTYDGDTLPTALLRGNVKWGRWQGAFRNAKPESVSGKASEDVVNNIKSKMKGYGNGSRAVVSVTYKNRSSGHVFNVEQRKGKTIFVDAQSGERLWAKNFMDIVDRSTVTLTRTDNLKISDRAKNFVTAESIYKRSE